MKRQILTYVTILVTAITANAQTQCTSTSGGQFNKSSNWSCPNGVAYYTADQLVMDHNMDIPNNNLVSIAADVLTLSENTTLTFGANSKLIMPTAGAYIELKPMASILTNNNSSGTLIEINGQGVWGNACSGCSNQTLLGPGFITENSPPANPIQGNLLPVAWLAVELSKSATQTFIQWKVQEFRGTTGYTVQYSADGNQWEDIAYREALGADDRVYAYRVEVSQAGEGYIRIRQEEVTGDDNYSKIVYHRHQADGIVLYPNPANGQVAIGGLVDAQSYQILDMRGKVVQQGVYSPGQTLTLEALPAQMYILRVPAIHAQTTLIKQ